MNIKINSNFPFSVTSIQFASDGGLCISIFSHDNGKDSEFQYTASLGEGCSERKTHVSLAQYALDFAERSNIKQKTRWTYHTMVKHLREYGDTDMDKVSTAYLHGFIEYLNNRGLKSGTVCLDFQKPACVLHDAYKNEMFDDRILQRVKRPKRGHEKKWFCVMLLTRGVPIYTVQRLMCHSDIGATYVYADLTGKTKAKAVMKLPPLVA